MGNYDDGVGFERDECGCAYTNPVDKALGDQSLEWTKAAVTSENKAFLRTLVTEIRFVADDTRVLLVHGSPRHRSAGQVRGGHRNGRLDGQPCVSGTRRQGAGLPKE
jgi:hypothetical protein